MVMKNFLIFPIILIMVLSACNSTQKEQPTDPAEHVAWARNATIYEVNVRQFTPEGTLRALEKELPRLQKMGIDILWLMPIHPLGEKNRKGSLGSYYAVRDYLAVNPEYGTMQEFRDFVQRAHELNMKVIIDWVANHTSWDNELAEKHPDWYKKDSAGRFVPPVADWSDVIALDYSNRELREYMTDALRFWVKEADIDGYRCDVAGMLPVSFWHEAIPEIKKIKPVFMLAEEETPKIHDSGYFDASYSWGIHRLMNDIAQGKKSAVKIDSAWAAESKAYPPDAFRMRFTSNHDENSWNGTEFERLGEGARAFAVFTFTFPGIPLIYSGQESAMNRRLRFFDKDTIPWGNYPLEPFYTVLTGLKKKNTLLDAGDKGGAFIKLSTSADKSVYAFVRKNNENAMVVILNFSATGQTVELSGEAMAGDYVEAFTGVKKSFGKKERITLTPWAYMVYER
jgi:glycosidase